MHKDVLRRGDGYNVKANSMSWSSIDKDPLLLSNLKYSNVQNCSKCSQSTDLQIVLGYLLSLVVLYGNSESGVI